MALAIDPGDGTALANYAALVLEKRHEPGRVQDHADPSNTATLYNYAAMLEDHVGDFKGASRMLQVSLQIDPTSRDIRGRLATVQRRRSCETLDSCLLCRDTARVKDNTYT
jgi:hypothetical protein